MKNISVLGAFEGKSVVITGATGFVGKVLVEKILRDIPRVKKVYILLRSKRGANINERFSQFKSSQAFQRIKTENMLALDKLVPIESDFSNKNSFGISAAELAELNSEVSFVFHLAASVRFDDPIDEAIKVNFIVMKTFAEMAKKFQKLESFVHVSTIGANVHCAVQEEKIHQAAFDFKKALDIVENNHTEKFEYLNQAVSKGFPNTYTFSKHLAEQFIKSELSNLPMVIVRAPIVLPCDNEPLEGWVDFYGTAIGIQVGIMCGVIRSVYGKERTKIPHMPCDYLVNSIIVSAALRTTNRDKELKVYNCAYDNCTVAVKTLRNYGLSNALELSPSETVLWHPNIKIFGNWYWYLVNFVVFQYVPSLFFDVFMRILGRKVLKQAKIQKTIFKMMKSFAYFTENSIDFRVRNLKILNDYLPENER